tara:strand:- start:88 stop:216 length:129 start_codon:yes stop_codon:yes gene_type:complete
MASKLENLVDLIFEKLKKYKSKKIFLEKEDLKNFIKKISKEN